MTKILDGLKISAQIKHELKTRLKCRTTPPFLAVVLCSDDPASGIYVRNKIIACEEVGITNMLIKPFEKGVSTLTNPREHLIKTIEYLNSDININGILVQLPISPSIGMTSQEVFDTIDPSKDVDVLTPRNVGLLMQGRPLFVPCTPHGIQELLTRSGIEIAGKKVAIINRSDIVGKPLSALLMQDNTSANATVTVCHDKTPPSRLKEVCLSADIIVVAVGKPNFITPDMVHSKTIIVDVGINRVDGKIVGDVHHDCYDIVAAYSPVPGGVGPMTVTMLLYNTIKAQQQQQYSSGL